MSLKIAALASGRGSNLMSIHRACEDGKLNGKIVLALSNNPDAKLVKSAGEAGLNLWVKDHRNYESREAFDRAMLEAIRKSGADCIALCGYMRLLSKEFFKEYSGRILNVHPAILPSFPGVQGGKDAYEYGVRFTGCTVHFVTEEMDTGPVIIQGIIPISSTEIESAFMPRLHELEHRIYPQALQWLAEGRLKLEGRRVILIAEKSWQHSSIKSENGEIMQGYLVCPPLEGF